MLNLGLSKDHPELDLQEIEIETDEDGRPVAEPELPIDRVVVCGFTFKKKRKNRENAEGATGCSSLGEMRGIFDSFRSIGFDLKWYSADLCAASSIDEERAKTHRFAS